METREDDNNGLAGALELAKVIAAQCADIIEGVKTASAMTEHYATASWPTPIEAVVDTYSVFQALTGADARLPLEESLIVIVMAIREQLSLGMLVRIWWCTTDDMLSDGLTKGAVMRAPLLTALGDGRWQVTREVKQARLARGCTPMR